MKYIICVLAILTASFSAGAAFSKTCKMNPDLKVLLSVDQLNDFLEANEDSDGEACELLKLFSKSVRSDLSGDNGDGGFEKKIARFRHLLELTTNQDESSFEDILRSKLENDKEQVMGIDPQFRGNSKMGIDPQFRGNSKMGIDPQFRGNSKMGIDPQFRGSSKMGIDPQFRGSSKMGIDPQF